MNETIFQTTEKLFKELKEKDSVDEVAFLKRKKLDKIRAGEFTAILFNEGLVDVVSVSANSIIIRLSLLGREFSSYQEFTRKKIVNPVWQEKKFRDMTLYEHMNNLKSMQEGRTPKDNNK